MTANMIGLCLMLTLAPASVAFQWTSSAIAPANGSTVPACSGQDVTLAWNYSTSAAEHLINVEWRHTPDSGGDEVVLATLVMGSFFPAPGSPVHVQYIPIAGIRLQNVAVTDAGIYSVHVNVNLHGSVITEVQTVTVVVSDASLTTDGQLHIKMLPEAVYNTSTQEFNIQLACGTFHTVWESKAAVVWKTPSLQSLPSTSHSNGSFILTVPNPVVSGEYTCNIADNSAASLCVKSDSPLRRGATVSVDGAEARFAVTEARHQQEIAALQQRITSVENRYQQEMSALQENLTSMEHRHQQEMTSLENRHQQEVSALQENITATEQRHQQEMTSMENRHQQEMSALRQGSNADLIHQLEANFTAIFQTPCVALSTEQPSGVYLFLIGSELVSVYCDQDTDNGGWTVIQRRHDGSVDFWRDWSDYEDGFGNVEGEYWLGLRNIYTMTSQCNSYKLRVDLEDFSGNTAFAVYHHFSISGPSDNYRLSVSGYGGTIGNDHYGLSYNNNMMFTTRDSDHDMNGANCATASNLHGGWWYNNCGYTNLNGVYKGAGGSGNDGIYWYGWRQHNSLKRVEMKIRPA